jgi:hypothetical protein
MGVNHRGLDACVAEQFLDGTNIIAGLKQVSGERVPKAMGGRTFGDASPASGLADFTRYGSFVKMVPPAPSRSRINGNRVRRKHPLPAPIRAGVGNFILPLARAMSMKNLKSLENR